MPRATKRCGRPGCDEPMPCPVHTPVPWEGSDHARTQSWGWQQTSKAVVERDGGICYLCHQPGADGADHLVPVAEGGTDDPGNLAAVHDKVPPYCHRKKTAADRRRRSPTRAPRYPDMGG